MIFKYFTVIYIGFMLSSALAADTDKEELRKKFYLSVSDGTAAKIFLSELSSKGSNQLPLLNGYKAAMLMVMANHVYNPYSKLRYFLDGKKELEKAILLDPNNIELRFIRFSIQTNVPSFLGYADNKEEDRDYMLQHIHLLNTESSADQQLKKYIVQYLRDISYISAKQQQELLSNTH